MRGGLVQEHYVLQLQPREGDVVRKVAQEILNDAQFPLNELEEETFQGMVEALDPDNRTRTVG